MKKKKLVEPVDCGAKLQKGKERESNQGQKRVKPKKKKKNKEEKGSTIRWTLKEMYTPRFS